MDDIQAKFFEMDQPCPPEIPDCIKLREDYLAELKKYREQGICNACIERSLKYKYVTFILAAKNV